MYSIGDLAQLGGVTPRMLRHYHELGILVPADVDGATGYRRYDESQLADLFQVLALKGLGFALTDIKRVTDGGIGASELRGMLLLRRTELESELDEAASRLGRVESHIHRLESQMNGQPTRDVTVTTKRLPAVHLAVASGVSPSFASADIGPVIQPLYPRLCDALNAAGVEIVGPSIAYYDDTADGGVGVYAGFPIDESVTEVPGLDVVDLPEIALAATAIHHGDMERVDVDTVPAVYDWIRTHGFRTTGYSREEYLECPDDIAQWRTEMQFPIEPDHAA
ncbi:MAG TPA: MerR family transcriptional regulator [Ilumatobacter sp.]|nr:MerR family transcriptional regulator [Ilumatobacter sp.]